MTISKRILIKAIELGIKEASKSDVHNRYSAILINRNRIISHAHNTFKGIGIRSNIKLKCSVL